MLSGAKISAFTTSHDLPDLTFPEITFLRKGLDVQYLKQDNCQNQFLNDKSGYRKETSQVNQHSLPTNNLSDNRTQSYQHIARFEDPVSWLEVPSPVDDYLYDHLDPAIDVENGYSVAHKRHLHRVHTSLSRSPTFRDRNSYLSNPQCFRRPIFSTISNLTQDLVEVDEEDDTFIDLNARPRGRYESWSRASCANDDYTRSSESAVRDRCFLLHRQAIARTGEQSDQLRLPDSRQQPISRLLCHNDLATSVNILKKGHQDISHKESISPAMANRQCDFIPFHYNLIERNEVSNGGKKWYVETPKFWRIPIHKHCSEVSDLTFTLPQAELATGESHGDIISGEWSHSERVCMSRHEMPSDIGESDMHMQYCPTEAGFDEREMQTYHEHTSPGCETIDALSYQPVRRTSGPCERLFASRLRHGDMFHINVLDSGFSFERNS